MEQSQQDEIIVSKEMLKAVGSETRICILKALQERQKTQSELAAELKLAAPTILEHIDQLEAAGLIERMPEDRERKWKYYRLTKVGRNIIEHKKMNVVILLSQTFFILAVGLVAVYLFVPSIINGMVGSTGTQSSGSACVPLGGGGSVGSGRLNSGLTNLCDQSRTFLGISAMLLLVASLALFLGHHLWKKMKKMKKKNR